MIAPIVRSDPKLGISAGVIGGYLHRFDESTLEQDIAVRRLLSPDDGIRAKRVQLQLEDGEMVGTRRPGPEQAGDDRQVAGQSAGRHRLMVGSAEFGSPRPSLSARSDPGAAEIALSPPGQSV